MGNGLVTVQGVELDVSVADWEPVRLGGVARGFSGQPRSTARGTKRDHHFVGDVAGVPVAMAELYRALVEGEGHSWDFNDTSNLLASSRGLVPDVTGVVTGVSGKHGGGALFPDESDTTWTPGGELSTSTLMYWVKESGAWVHYLARYEGSGYYAAAVWRNAVRTDVDPFTFYVDVGGLLVAASSQNGEFQADDLVLLPYAVPDEWVDALIAWRTSNEWAPLPYVTASGGAFPSGPAQALGQVGTAKRGGLWTGGTFGLGEVLDFTLQQR